MSLFSKDLIEREVIYPSPTYDMTGCITFMGLLPKDIDAAGLVELSVVDDGGRLMIDPTNGNIYLVKY